MRTLRELVVLQISDVSHRNLKLVTAKQALNGRHRKNLRITNTGWYWNGTKYRFGRSINLSEGNGIVGVYNKYVLKHGQTLVRDVQNFTFSDYQRNGNPDIA